MSPEDPRERDDLCGRALVGELPGEDLAEEYDPSTWYEAEHGNHYCRREVWDRVDTDRCIWHADVADKHAEALAAARSEGPARLDRAVLRESSLRDGVSLSECRLQEADLRGADFREADLDGVDLQDGDLRGVNFRGVDLSDASLTYADISDADLRYADISDADLRYADLSYADLESADLGDANISETQLGSAILVDADLRDAKLWGSDLRNTTLRATDLHGADLRHTNLGRADLHGTDLTACSLHQTTFEDATFDESTIFGASSGHETAADATAEDASWLAGHVSSRLRGLGRPSTDSDLLEHAETQYRTFQRLRRENDLKQDPALGIQEKHARRKRALAERRYWDWFKLAFYRWPMGYGEKPWHVVGTSLVVILASTLAYQLIGPIARTPAPDDADVVGGVLLSTVPFTLPEWLAELLTSLYFSVVTFTTLGYGDLQPASGAAQAVATVESFLGALLMALLVFVLGRRATW